ncbi:unnamed protein product [Hyaloperonospora brassicae]|uniref:HTH myb-type domain-containing protein n=1 Tax=Hyaloperonospora brassicae TaxID=162125 RepID=A0AAV0UKJ2_HYABA|nr:unnamed protein product [Hyaloperonospora brassicae]
MASTAVLKSVRAHPKLLSLQHVEDAFLLSCTANAPMTPLGHDASMFTAATVSPRDPAAKLAAAAGAAAGAAAASASVASTSPTAAKLQSLPVAAFASHRACIPSSSASSDDASDDELDDETDDSGRAAAASASSAASAAATSSSSVKSNTGRWTEAEHQLFLQGLETFPYRAWKKIATLIKTRTVVQIRTHAQKYYQKLEKEEARLKERQAQDRAALAAATTTTATGATGAAATSPSLPSLLLAPPSSPTAQKKKMHLMRKRKCSLLDMDTDSDALVLPSVPKRLARELPLAAHMSPKQKQLSSLSGAKMLLGGHHSMDARFVFGRSSKSHAGMQAAHQLPLDFADAAAEAMILDFAEDKVLADYSLDCVDQTLASIDNDDLLQLTEEELEWFSTTSTESASVSGDVLTDGAMDVAGAECCIPESDPTALDCENFAADLCLDDEDFVLDPEKFLSSYFAPSEQA